MSVSRETEERLAANRARRERDADFERQLEETHSRRTTGWMFNQPVPPLRAVPDAFLPPEWPSVEEILSGKGFV